MEYNKKHYSFLIAIEVTILFFIFIVSKSNGVSFYDMYTLLNLYESLSILYLLALLSSLIYLALTEKIIELGLHLTFSPLVYIILQSA